MNLRFLWGLVLAVASVASALSGMETTQSNTVFRHFKNNDIATSVTYSRGMYTVSKIYNKQTKEKQYAATKKLVRHDSEWCVITLKNPIVAQRLFTQLKRFYDQ